MAMKRKMLISAMAVVIAFGMQSTAQAQFGGFKGLANKVKKAAKEKVENAASDAKNSVMSTAEQATGAATGDGGSVEQVSGSATPKKKIYGMSSAEYYYKKAKRTDWNYESNMRDVEADMAYWLKRLRASAEKDDKSQLDMEALERLTTGRPSFDFMDRANKDGYVTEGDIDAWQLERKRVVRAAIEVRDGVTLDNNWEMLSATDQEKALKKELNNEVRKATLLNRYKSAANMNRYAAGFSGNNAWVTNLVKENFPEWGKILASKINTDYKVNYTAAGVPKSRYHSAVVMCQDQGYKVLHFIQLSQPYKGGGKYGPSEVRYGGMKWSDAVTLVK